MHTGHILYTSAVIAIVVVVVVAAAAAVSVVLGQPLYRTCKPGLIARGTLYKGL
jgi:hypothetical protein